MNEEFERGKAWGKHLYVLELIAQLRKQIAASNNKTETATLQTLLDKLERE